jgi:hypothetical protein
MPSSVCVCCAKSFHTPGEKTVLPCCRSLAHADCLLRKFVEKAPQSAATTAATNFVVLCNKCHGDIEVLDSFHSLQEIQRRLPL